MARPEPTFSIVAGSDLALALAAAHAASERADVSDMDDKYRLAVQVAAKLDASQPGLRSAIAVEHISQLREHHGSIRALARCEEYLKTYGDDVRLLLRRIETAMTLDDLSGADAELAYIRRLETRQPLTQVDDELLRRLENFAADRDAVTPRNPPKPRNGRRPTTRHRHTTQGRLGRADELRLDGRYEDALDELELALTEPHDPALRFFLLEAKVRLLRILRADDEADMLMADLFAAADTSALPAENRERARRLEAEAFERDSVIAMTTDHAVLHARVLIVRGRLAEAQEILRDAHDPSVNDERHIAEWNLAMAELFMAISRWSASTEGAQRADTAARLAATHAQDCVEHANTESPVAIRISALRLLGHAHAHSGEIDLAVRMWATAHREEESVAALQRSDRYRLRMLQAAPTEFDELIRWARSRGTGKEPDAPEHALVATAIEAGRGSAILPHILPKQQTRQLPEPGDVAGARRWLRRAISGLPRSQAIWMLHNSADTVYHVFIWRTWRGPRIRVHSVEAKRVELIKEIDELVKLWTNSHARKLVRYHDAEKKLEDAEEFESQLAVVAGWLGIDELPELPEHIRRIAMVAGGELSEIPFALLPCPGAQHDLIGRRFALSDLPCLAARAPLSRRSRRQRGLRGSHMLLLRGPEWAINPISPAAPMRGRTPLSEEESTPVRLDKELSTGNYRVVRIDSHGTFRGGASESVLLLAPDETEQGKLRADQLQGMALGETGTLIVGACESGMFTRIGRDERTGFVRAGLTAGASAVVAARWEALDFVAVGMLDRFEIHLRRHPRDTALFLTQRDAEILGVPPSQWGAWTLYGATNYQTRRGPVWRWLSRKPVLWQRSAIGA